MLEKKNLILFSYAAFLLVRFCQHKVSEHGKYFHKFKLKKRFKKDTFKLSSYFPFVFIKPFYIFWFQIKETFVCSLLPNFWNDQFFAAFSGTKRWKFVSSVMSNCDRLVAVLKKSLVLSFSD